MIRVAGFLPVLHFGSLSLPTYFFVVALDFCVCLLWLVRRAEARRFSRNVALDLSMALMVGGFLGARVFHVFFEEPRYYSEDWTRVLEFWRGGFVWYGGALAGSACAAALVRRRGLPLLAWLDVFAPVAALGYAIGRVACVLEGCCFGGVCEFGSIQFQNPSLAFVWESLFKDVRFLYPTQMFAVLWELSVLGLLLKVERRLFANGSLFALWLGLHCVGRVLMESFRADPRGSELLGLSVSTWISAALFAAVILSQLGSRRRRLN